MVLMMERLMGLTFGEVVRRRRVMLGLTQEELGARVGWDSTRVSKVELGQTYRRLPDAETFRKWAQALEVDPIILLRQLGYAGDQSEPTSMGAEMVFAQLADEIQAADNMPVEVQETMLDGLRMARRMYEVKTGRITKS